MVRDLLIIETGVVHSIKETEEDENADDEDDNEAASEEGDDDIRSFEPNGESVDVAESSLECGAESMDAPMVAHGESKTDIEGATTDSDKSAAQQEVKVLQLTGTQLCEIGFLFGMRQDATLLAFKRTSCLALSVCRAIVKRPARILAFRVCTWLNCACRCLRRPTRTSRFKLSFLPQYPT